MSVCIAEVSRLGTCSRLRACNMGKDGESGSFVSGVDVDLQCTVPSSQVKNQKSEIEKEKENEYVLHIWTILTCRSRLILPR